MQEILNERAVGAVACFLNYRSFVSYLP